jgi:hypothetical protein
LEGALSRRGYRGGQTVDYPLMCEWGDLVQSNIGGLPRGPALVPFRDYLLELLPSLNDVSELLLQLLGLYGYGLVPIRVALVLWVYLISLELARHVKVIVLAAPISASALR